MSDKAIWEAFQQGRKEALEYIYRLYIHDLYQYGIKVKAHRHIVKDCIQELFVELWRRREHLSATDNIKFYLLKALKLKINRDIKKEQPYFHANLQQTPAEQIVSSPESQLIQNQANEERMNHLHQQMEALPGRQQEILHLLFFEGLSYDEVSEIMAINVRSVYTLAWKSLSSLRKKLS